MHLYKEVGEREARGLGVTEEGIRTIFSHPATQPDIPVSCSYELIPGIVLLDHCTGAQNTGQGPSCFLNQTKLISYKKHSCSG